MTCPHCADLKARIRELEAILVTKDRIAKVAGSFQVSGTKARLLLAMYQRRGHVVRRDHLMDVASTDSRNSFKATMCYLRRNVGREMIYTSAGIGYGLTNAGLEAVKGALEA